jgi:two-component system phosphate regulon sensor histidine kinase PhoR
LPYLFAAVRRNWNGQIRYIILEYDLPYLVSTVFPQFFNVHSKSLYQVVDENGALVYGFPFQGVPENEVVEVPFGSTLTRWRLRAVQKEARAMVDRQSRQATVDGVMIGLALLVIVAGLAALVGLMRYERRLNQLKSDFISNVSHELKTPLSIISMFGELLSLGRFKGPEQSKEYADIIRRESTRLSRLIDNVLDFAKIERGAHVYEFENDEDLGAVVSTAVEISKPRLQRENMEIDLSIAVDLPPARLDLNAMTLAVLNLIDNAIKYASDGKKVEVSLSRHGEGMELKVRDHGPGVPPGEAEMIFERFYRSRAVRKRPIRGSGIGLALVRDVVSAHGGMVSVESNADRGATFRVWIPAQNQQIAVK